MLDYSHGEEVIAEDVNWGKGLSGIRILANLLPVIATHKRGPITDNNIIIIIDTPVCIYVFTASVCVMALFHIGAISHIVGRLI